MTQSGSKHDRFMQEVLKLARAALAEGGPPLAALVRQGDRIAARAHALPDADELRQHPELMAMESAGEAARGASLYAAVEPCAMCFAAAALMGVREVIYAVPDPRQGGFHTLIPIGDLAERSPAAVGGILRQEALALLRQFVDQHPKSPRAPHLRKLLDDTPLPPDPRGLPGEGKG